MVASLKYFKMDGASAKDLSSSQVLKEYPKVYMSESERIPGYLNKLQVPPISSLASRIKKFLSGFFLFRWHAAPIPDKPAPMF